MLRTHSTITVETPEGAHQIQLLFGDITALPIEEKVDVIIVSAFQGDYAATRTSVIGALHNNLSLSVRQLSSNKEEDLRQSFNCWWSKQLPATVPYRRLLCFETPYSRGFKHPAELVSNVFRCLVPVFKNEPKTVITPLLSTGDQNFSKKRMMRSMIEAAINWIRAGLPLKCLKIVLYKRDAANQQFFDEERSLIELFDTMKSKLEAAQTAPVEEQVEYDIYMSYEEKDSGRVQEIRDMMLQQKSDIRIFADHQYLDTEAAFQKDIHRIMTKCRRIVTFLSPSYLQSEMCLEQYNIAMCCNRMTKRHMLAPFYIETVTCMPTYMQLVQYIDCRNQQKFMQGFAAFLAVFQTTVRYSLLKPLATHYDVFISYSHRNSEKARTVLDVFKKIDNELSIFFDKEDLETGSSWQQTLYNSLDNSDVVITLLSPDYLASQVCQEEYNIALAKHASEDHEIELIPVMVDRINQIPRSFAEVKIIDATQEFESVIHTVCSAVKAYNKTKNRKDEEIFNNLENPFDVPNLMETYRKYKFEESGKSSGVPSSSGTKAKKPLGEVNGTSSDQCDVAFISADHKYACFLDTLLKTRVPSITTNFMVKTVKGQMESLDSARIVVPVFTQNFFKSGKDVDELHVALARHRKTLGHLVLYPVQVTELPRWPTYIHLIPCAVAACDPLWKEKSKLPEFVLPADVRNAETKIAQTLGQNFTAELALAISEACDDIIAILQEERKDDRRNTVLHNIVEVEYDIKLQNAKDLGIKEVNSEKLLKKICPTPQLPIEEKSTKPLQGNRNQEENSASEPLGEEQKQSRTKTRSSSCNFL